MITVEVDNKRALDALNRLIRSGKDPAPVLKSIGEDLIASTKRRIASGGPARTARLGNRIHP
jgi:hypothetical protein